jgi:hypothetical protein
MLMAGSVIIGRREGEDALTKKSAEKEKAEAGDAGSTEVGSVSSGADVSPSGVVDRSLMLEWTLDGLTLLQAQGTGSGKEDLRKRAA